MPIITIYQGASGSGEALAKSVAETLGYRCISREILLEASRVYGIPAAKLNEILEREPQWWNRWLEDLRPYRIALQAAMCEVAQGGNLVYHGHIGHELLPGIRHVLKVLLTAPLKFRIEQVRAQQGLDEKAARRYIDQVDKARTRRLFALFGSDWRDSSRYDLVLNMAKVSLEAAGQLVTTAARLLDYQPTAASEQDFQNLSLAARVQAALMISPRGRNIGIDVQAEQGQVRVSGILPRSVSEQEIIQLIKGVSGVEKVETNFIDPIEHFYGDY